MLMKEQIQVLLIEDSNDDANLIRMMVDRVREPDFSLVHARRLSEGLELLNSHVFDVVLLDLGLPDSDGFETVKKLKKIDQKVPVIVLTGVADEEIAIKTLKMDVQDYLTKEQINGNLLVRSIRYAIERKRVVEALEKSEARFRRLSDSGVIGIAEFDIRGGISDANDTFLSMIGYSREELEKGLVRWDNLLPPQWLPSMLKVAKTFMTTGRILPYQTEYCRRDGSKFWGLFGAVRFEGKDGGIAYVVDITERKKLEEKIRHMANHDDLTDLPNRRLFLELIRFEAEETNRNQKKMGLLFLDVDRFKSVNDTLGHEAGDELLKMVAVRLRSAIRKSDIVARIGGDEFSILLSSIICQEDITEIIKKIQLAFREKCIIAGREFSITTSVGVSVYPDDSTDIDTLFRYADIALYRSKDRGGDAFEFYNSIKAIRC